MPVLLILLLLPLIEIALFIAVGGWLGLWATLALVVLSALAGVLILRGQHDRALQMMQGGLRHVAPGTFLAQGAFRMFAGMLLIAPGFFTDAIALILLLPPVQRMIVRSLGKGISVSTVHVHRQGDIVDAEYEVYEPHHDTPPPERIEGPHRH
ncbi:FxsA family protein [Pararhodobacter sp.]|uniref:FxsA family protein n=1 Tax=Pararhodobacter sp. TaxID=2127056 RepID=UPI002FDE1989